MIDATEAQLVQFSKAPVGSLVVIGTGASAGMPAIVYKEDDLQGAFLLVHPFGDVELGPRIPVLDLGKPIVRFDPASALADPTICPTGALVVTGTGPRVFDSGHSGRWLISMDGELEAGSPSANTPAFRRWSVGFLRDDKFVSVGDTELA
jgi:hypothetical protein